MSDGSPSAASLWDFVRGAAAVARLTMLEATRQRFWWLVLIAMAGLLLIIPTLQAVDDGARLKLAVAAVSGTIGFILTLVSVLVVIIAVRRDLESRCSFMLFAKPLPRLAYCLGRWGGAILTLALAVLLLSLAGAAAIRLQLGVTPQPQTTLQVSEWQLLDSLGGVSAVRGDQRIINIDQRVGSGLRAQFNGLASDGREQFLLVKATVRGRDGFTPFSSAVVQVAALVTAADGSVQPRLLRLAAVPGEGAEVAARSAARSAAERASGLGEGPLILRHRGLQRTDLQADYLRLRIPPEAIAADGNLTVQMLRMDNEAVIGVPRVGGILVTTRGLPFVIDLLKAGAVQLAHAGVLAAAAMVLVIVAGVGTSLLGCLTLFFGAHAVGVVAGMSQSPQTSLLARRLMDLIVPIIPDFGRFPVAAELAAAQSISLSSIVGAWLYFGMWMVVMLAGAWLMLTRKEL